MRRLAGIGLGIVLSTPAALGDGASFAGSFWQCTRSKDQSKFIITFYPGGGVGGGELNDGEISPYIFDASRTKAGQWPGRWEQRGRRFTWLFPDQNMRIEGMLTEGSLSSTRLSGTETASGERSSIECIALSKLPVIGEGLVIPRGSRFIDLDRGEGELKVPAGISLQEQGTR